VVHGGIAAFLSPHDMCMLFRTSRGAATIGQRDQCWFWLVRFIFHNIPMPHFSIIDWCATRALTPNDVARQLRLWMATDSATRLDSHIVELVLASNVMNLDWEHLIVDAQAIREAGEDSNMLKGIPSYADHVQHFNSETISVIMETNGILPGTLFVGSNTFTLEVGMMYLDVPERATFTVSGRFSYEAHASDCTQAHNSPAMMCWLYSGADALPMIKNVHSLDLASCALVISVLGSVACMGQRFHTYRIVDLIEVIQDMIPVVDVVGTNVNR
jgi:hypothetical protein